MPADNAYLSFFFHEPCTRVLFHISRVISCTIREKEILQIDYLINICRGNFHSV